jgi:hypothetical protein
MDRDPSIQDVSPQQLAHERKQLDERLRALNDEIREYRTSRPSRPSSRSASARPASHGPASRGKLSQ